MTDNKIQPKEVTYIGKENERTSATVYDTAKCPGCGHIFRYGINDYGSDYCPDCGQALTWHEAMNYFVLYEE